MCVCLEQIRPKAENGEPMVFYKKLQVIFPIFFHSQFAPLQSVPKQADYYRYLAEFLEGDGHKEVLVLNAMFACACVPLNIFLYISIIIQSSTSFNS